MVEVVDFGPHLYGSTLHLKPAIQWKSIQPGLPTVVDAETDEKDGWVGLALSQDPKHVYYVTKITPALKNILENSPLIGHSLKGDLKWLINWGVKVKSSQLYYDTALASYVQNTTKESHGLKALAKEYLGMEWPTYKQMVGSGKKKVTLDKQSIERVANYCSMDCLATYRLYEYFQKTLTAKEKNYLETIELPTARALLDMEVKGVKIDIEHFQKLDIEFNNTMIRLELTIQEQWAELETDKPLNVNSNAQIAQLLMTQGAKLPKTLKGNYKVDKKTLEGLTHLPVVPLLQEYSKIEKLRSTYTKALLEKQKNERIYCSFNQISKNDKGHSVGISTGRLSSSNPNLQNIPTRTEEGKQIRQGFIATADKTFLDADFSQIEYRLLAHFTQDKLLLDAYRTDKDLHEETIKLILGKSEVSKAERDLGKTLNFASVYGAQADKIAYTAKISRFEAQQFLKTYFQKLPGLTAWINRVKYIAHQKKGVETLMGRWIPLPNINSTNKYERLHWERVAVNTIIQGSASEINKIAIIKLHKADLLPSINVHDENLIEVENKNIEQKIVQITNIMENVVKLDVPLKVEIGVGRTWNESKK